MNEKPDTCLHGGPVGWAKQNWEGPFHEERNGRKSTIYTIVSEHLDQGFPGKVEAKVFYTPYSVTNDDGVEEFFLEIEYECRLTEDSPVDETVVNMTNHSHLNVTPNPLSIEGTRVKFFSRDMLAKDPNTGVITGEIKPDQDVPEDLSFFTMTKEGPSFDSAYVLQDLEKCDGIDTRSKKPVPAVHYYHPDSKVNCQIFTTEPVYQVYSCGGLNIAQLEGESRPFPKRSGIACEPGRPTYAACIDKWRPWVSLKKGEVWGSKIVYCTWVGETKEY